MGKTDFVETREYHRFVEFCDACRRDKYIGLCYGPPGVGKTLSAGRYANWEEVSAAKPCGWIEGSLSKRVLTSHTVFYTTKVLNSPGQIEREIGKWRAHLQTVSLPLKEFHEWEAAAFEEVRIREKRERLRFYGGGNGRQELAGTFRMSEPTFEQVSIEGVQRRKQITDPTQLILVDEADRLKMGSLEQLRDIFDQGGIGIVLIGMPGLEKRLARYPQLYSRIGFVHEFRPLQQKEMRQLLGTRWQAIERVIPKDGLADEEAIAAIIRVTGGNFRLLHRLLTQIGRILEINGLNIVSREVVEAARESLVIGTV